MEFDLIFPNTAQDWKDMATLFSEELYKVGVKANLIPKDTRSMLESGHAHDFDMLFSSWGTSPLPDDFTQIWHTSSWKNNGSNYSGFGTPESDALIDSINLTYIPSLYHLASALFYTFRYSWFHSFPNHIHLLFFKDIIYNNG